MFRVISPVQLPMFTVPVPVVPRFRTPEPFGATVRFAFDVVPSVAAEPFPRLRAVESIPRVTAASIVARLAAVIVSTPRVKSPVVLPILTADVPVALIFAAPPVMVRPAFPVMSPVEVSVPVISVFSARDIFPVVLPPRVRVLFRRV